MIILRFLLSFLCPSQERFYPFPYSRLLQFLVYFPRWTDPVVPLMREIRWGSTPVRASNQLPWKLAWSSIAYWLAQIRQISFIVSTILVHCRRSNVVVLSLVWVLLIYLVCYCANRSPFLAGTNQTCCDCRRSCGRQARTALNIFDIEFNMSNKFYCIILRF